jgi:transcriptional antiterminator RfaH
MTLCAWNEKRGRFRRFRKLEMSCNAVNIPALAGGLSPVQASLEAPLSTIVISSAAAWFCVRTHPKHEHIAAAQLRQEPDIEVFLPRIRYRRSTRSGPAWVNEALFKDYLFARFELSTALRRVKHSRSVRDVIHFGDRWPTVPEIIIAQLQDAMGGEDLRLVEDPLQPGDNVRIASGAMSGLEAVVTRVMPSKQRVALLLDFLGRQTAVEMNRNDLTFVAEDESRRVRVPLWQRTTEASPILA